MTDIQESQKRPLGHNVRTSHFIAIGLALSVTLWIGSGVVSGTAPEKGEEAAPTAKTETRTLVRVRKSQAQTHERHAILYGRTEAVRDIELSAETAGKVIARPIEKGASLKKGTSILKLAIDDRLSKLREAEAKVEFQKLAYDSAKKLSRKQFQSKIKVAEEKSKLESAKAALAAIRLDVSRTNVRAPIDGYLETLPVNVGDYVKAGDVVATIVNLDPIRVVAQVSERLVANLKLGDLAWATIPGGEVRQGAIRYISRMSTSVTRTFRVEIWLDNPTAQIPQGLTAELHLVMGATRAHLVSPAVLTLDDTGIIGVKAVDGEGKVVFYAAEIIEDTTEGVWLGDLPEQLTLITVGQEFVRAGQTVDITDETAAKPTAKQDTPS